MKYPFRREYQIVWYALIAVLFIGFGAGWMARVQYEADAPSGASGFEIREGGYQFINPLLECETAQETVGGRELRPFKGKLQNMVRELTKSGVVTHMSVYFRDLNNGPWFGIEERELFSPASMLKVIVMIACLKEAESNPSLLKKKVLYGPYDVDENERETIKPEQSIVRGRSYSVDELLAMMVRYSDNNAMRLLLSAMDMKIMEKTYADLGLETPRDINGEDFMSVKQYASCYRILFNASYLSRESSEKALRLLSEAGFREGLAGGAPQGVPISHKFGERIMGQRGEIKQLHDCGIVYYPNGPYLLCIMTRGRSFELQVDAIREASFVVFQEIDSQHRNR